MHTNFIVKPAIGTPVVFTGIGRRQGQTGAVVGMDPLAARASGDLVTIQIDGDETRVVADWRRSLATPHH